MFLLPSFPVGKKCFDMLTFVRDGFFVAGFGMQWADRTLAASLVDRVVYICPDFVSAREAYRQFCTLRDDVVYLPAKDDVLTFIRSRSNESAHTRLAALHAIITGRAGVVVASLEAAMQLFPTRKDFLDNCHHLRAGEEYSSELLVSLLVAAGYKREAQVLLKGQFSQRGDILDIAPLNMDSGVRLEFFGDELESIKTMDFSTQISSGKLDFVDIAPCSEFFAKADGKQIMSRMRADIPSGLEQESKARINNILSEIEFKIAESCTDISLSYALPYAPHGTLLDFLGSDYVIALDEIKKLHQKMVYSEHCNRYKQLLQRGELLLSSINQITQNPFQNMQNSELQATNGATVSELQPTNGGFSCKVPLLGFYKNPESNDFFEADRSVVFDSMPLPSYTKNLPALIEDIEIWRDKGMKIVLFCGSEATRDRFEEFLREHGVYSSREFGDSVCVVAQELYRGAVLFDANTVLIGTYDLIAKKTQKTIKRSRKDVFSQPQVGEFVVHETHGIGVCECVEKLESSGSTRDYLVIRYRDGDKLFVPVENMDSLTKYNSGEESPHLSKIGGADFSRAKERVRASVKKMAFDLLKLYAERSMEKGHIYEPHTEAMEEFYQDFPHVETDDQLAAIEEGLADLASGKIMERLLCGDVGYGKTEVALRLAYNVILGGKQVAFVSPTTILARQHFGTVKERMEKFGVKCVSLTRLNSPEATKRALIDLKSGKADIVCGTHRALSKDVAFKDLGLLILDEEQRFGVADKEKIKLLRKNVGVLSLSATPIPRTLHMSMSGIRDISILDTPPLERIPVQTYVTEYTDSLLVDAIHRELARGGQAFVVYNRVSSIDSFAARVRDLTGEEVSVIHGQMPEKQMEDTLSTFIAGETKILVASTIIENGIDMPRANTMIVVDADRLGLSQLYQLRGRIGRSNRLAYVFFTFDESKTLTESAFKRLESINEFTEFGSGFKVAMRDLQIRGAGNIMGREQHGHMEKVGYDMYLKILSEELEKLKGGEVREHSEVRVHIDFDAFIPKSYIQDTEWRLKVYSRISHIDTLEEIARLENELTDIYGKVPTSVSNLCKVALVKNRAAAHGVDSVTLKKQENSLNYKKVIDIPQKTIDRINNGKQKCHLKLTPTISISFGKEEKAMLDFLLN